jgi:hypothetical protein
MICIFLTKLVISYDIQTTTTSPTNPSTVLVSAMSISIRTYFLPTRVFFFNFYLGCLKTDIQGQLDRVTDYSPSRIPHLLACDAESMCNRNPNFRGNDLASFSRADYVSRTLKMKNTSKC